MTLSLLEKDIEQFKEKYAISKRQGLPWKRSERENLRIVMVKK